MGVQAIEGGSVAKKRPVTNPSGKPTATRNRVDLRVDPEWLARVERQAMRLGLPLSSYFRMAMSKQLEADEATDPELK